MPQQEADARDTPAESRDAAARNAAKNPADAATPDPGAQDQAVMNLMDRREGSG